MPPPALCDACRETVDGVLHEVPNGRMPAWHVCPECLAYEELDDGAGAAPRALSRALSIDEEVGRHGAT